MLSKGATIRLRKAMNRRTAVQLRLQGKSYVEIGKILNIPRSVAYKYVLESMKEIKKEEHESTEQIRTTQAKRYDRLLEIALESVESHHDGPSMDRALRIMAEQNRLYPIAAPIETKTTVENLSYNKMIEALSNDQLEEEKPDKETKMELLQKNK